MIKLFKTLKFPIRISLRKFSENSSQLQQITSTEDVFQLIFDKFDTFDQQDMFLIHKKIESMKETDMDASHVEVYISNVIERQDAIDSGEYLNDVTLFAIQFFLQHLEHLNAYMATAYGAMLIDKIKLFDKTTFNSVFFFFYYFSVRDIEEKTRIDYNIIETYKKVTAEDFSFETDLEIATLYLDNLKSKQYARDFVIFLLSRSLKEIENGPMRIYMTGDMGKKPEISNDKLNAIVSLYGFYRENRKELETDKEVIGQLEKIALFTERYMEKYNYTPDNIFDLYNRAEKENLQASDNISKFI